MASDLARLIRIRRTGMTTGLVFGKFYPPHRGHKHLIDRAATLCDHLTVMVMAAGNEDIPGDLRTAWLRETHPNVTVLHTPYALRQSWPEEDEISWARFTAFVRTYHPERIDRVFTSEWYGPSAARRLGAEHVSVDPQRRTVPISSTLVRQSPWRYAAYLEPCVRAYYVKRVVLCGAESTGKTTLAQELAQIFETAWVTEYGREFSDAAGHTIERPHAWRPEDFAAIAGEQERRIGNASRSANRLVICDTDALATQVWQERYLGEQVHYPYPRAHLYLLTDPGIPFVQDGTRDGERYRAWMTQRFRDVLAAEGLPFSEISGGREARRGAAIEAIERHALRPG